MSFNYYTLLQQFAVFPRRRLIISSSRMRGTIVAITPVSSVGWIPKAKTDLYVNLRCMNILPQTFTLYAGGGLLAASQLEDEWQETEDKLDTMRRIVGNL